MRREVGDWSRFNNRRQVSSYCFAPPHGDANGSAAARKKEIVAVARQLAVDLWRLFTGQTSAENLRLIHLPEAV